MAVNPSGSLLMQFVQRCGLAVAGFVWTSQLLPAPAASGGAKWALRGGMGRIYRKNNALAVVLWGYAFVWAFLGRNGRPARGFLAASEDASDGEAVFS
jgi:hypothetical protein